MRTQRGIMKKYLLIFVMILSCCSLNTFAAKNKKCLSEQGKIKGWKDLKFCTKPLKTSSLLKKCSIVKQQNLFTKNVKPNTFVLIKKTSKLNHNNTFEMGMSNCTAYKIAGLTPRIELTVDNSQTLSHIRLEINAESSKQHKSVFEKLEKSLKKKYKINKKFFKKGFFSLKKLCAEVLISEKLNQEFPYEHLDNLKKIAIREVCIDGGKVFEKGGIVLQKRIKSDDSGTYYSIYLDYFNEKMRKFSYSMYFDELPETKVGEDDV